MFVFLFQAEDGIRDGHVTGVQTCALPISGPAPVEVPELVARPGAGEGRVLAGYAESTAEEVAAVADFFAERWSPDQTAAVLCRARSAFSAVVEALRARGVPGGGLGVGGLVAGPEGGGGRAAHA